MMNHPKLSSKGYLISDDDGYSPDLYSFILNDEAGKLSKKKLSLWGITYAKRKPNQSLTDMLEAMKKYDILDDIAD